MAFLSAVEFTSPTDPCPRWQRQPAIHTGSVPCHPAATWRCDVQPWWRGYLNGHCLQYVIYHWKHYTRRRHASLNVSQSTQTTQRQITPPLKALTNGTAPASSSVLRQMQRWTSILTKQATIISFVYSTYLTCLRHHQGTSGIDWARFFTSRLDAHPDDVKAIPSRQIRSQKPYTIFHSQPPEKSPNRSLQYPQYFTLTRQDRTELSCHSKNSWFSLSYFLNL